MVLSTFIPTATGVETRSSHTTFYNFNCPDVVCIVALLNLKYRYVKIEKLTKNIDIY